VSLSQLHIHQVRNLRHVALSDLQRVNVFYGENGSGKTSILESIHLLGMARSFRGSSVKTLITHGEADCTVHGVTSRGPSSDSERPLGVKRGRSGEAQIRVNGDTVRTVAELAANLPLQVITADSFGLLTGAPGGRRRFVDWGVFHVEHRFFQQWQRFQRSLKQRNMLLRRGNISDIELETWSRDLAQLGEAVNAYRVAYFEQLAPLFYETLAQLAPSLGGLELRFRPGWDSKLSYAEALQLGKVSDLEQGYTHTGPQRADIRVTSEGHLASETLSRGQQKLVVCALKLAQGLLLRRLEKGECTYLIDDLPSELDENHSRLVCDLLASMDAQVFLTCVEAGEIQSVWPEKHELAMFHVEHGSVTPCGASA